eukprot:5121690-Prymnesium_polylepis.1
MGLGSGGLGVASPCRCPSMSHEWVRGSRARPAAGGGGSPGAEYVPHASDADDSTEHMPHNANSTSR